MPDNKNPWGDTQSAIKKTFTTNELVTHGAVNPNYEVKGEQLDRYLLASEKYGEFNPVELDPYEVLAQNQPIADKWANAFTKGLYKFGSTALNTIAGVVVTPANIIGNALQGDLEFSDVWNDPLTRTLDDWDKQLEEALPNYQTQYRQDSPWYKDLGTADFWADGVLKNIGFAAGAVAGTIATFGAGALVADSSLGLKTAGLASRVGKVFKAADNAEDIVRAIKTGDAAVDSIKALKTSETLGKTIRGGAIGALAESKVEAVQTYTEAKQKFLDEGLDEVTADKYAKIAANVDFALNFPTLVLSNSLQFNTLFGNGNTFGKALSNLKNKAFSPLKGIREAKGFWGKLGKTVGAVGTYSTSPLREGLEEWSQYKFNVLSKDYAQRLSDTGSTYDFDLLKDAFSSSLADITKSPEDGYFSGDATEQFVTGALLGALGIPTLQRNSAGKLRPTLAGGIGSEIRERKADALEQEALGKRTAEVLQDIRNTNGKNGVLTNMLVNQSFDLDIQEAYDNGEIGTAKTLEAQKLANLIYDAVDTGNINELSQNLNVIATAPEVRELARTKNSEGLDVDPLQHLSDEQVMQKVEENRAKTKKYINTVTKLYESLKPLENTIGKENTRNLVTQLAAVDEANDRLRIVSGELLNTLSKVPQKYEEDTSELEVLNKVLSQDIEGTLADIANNKDFYKQVEKARDAIQYAIKIKRISPQEGQEAFQKLIDLYGQAKNRNNVLDLYVAATQGQGAYIKKSIELAANEVVKETYENQNKVKGFTQRLNTDKNNKFTNILEDSLETPVYFGKPGTYDVFRLQQKEDGSKVVITPTGEEIPFNQEFINNNLEITPITEEQFLKVGESAKVVKKQQAENTNTPDVTNDSPIPSGEGEVTATFEPDPKKLIDRGFRVTAGKQVSKEGQVNEESSQQRWYNFINTVKSKDLFTNYKLRVTTRGNNPFNIPFYEGSEQAKQGLNDTEALDKGILETIVTVVNSDGSLYTDESGLPVYTHLHELNWDDFAYPEAKGKSKKEAQKIKQLQLANAKKDYILFLQSVLETQNPIVDITGKSKGITGSHTPIPAIEALGYPTLNDIPVIPYQGKGNTIRLITSTIEAQPGNIYSETALGDPVVMYRTTLNPKDQEIAFQLIKGILQGTKDTIKGLSYREALGELVYVGPNSKYPKYNLFFPKGVKGIKIGENLYTSVSELEANKDAILDTLKDKVYNVIASLIDTNLPYTTLDIKEDKLVEGVKYPNYKSYLLDSSNQDRVPPLLAKAPLFGTALTVNRYLTFDYKLPVEQEEVLDTISFDDFFTEPQSILPPKEIPTQSEDSTISTKDINPSDSPFMLQGISINRDPYIIKANIASIFGEEFVGNFTEVSDRLIKGKAFGRFTKDGRILVSELSPEGTEYHEAFHRVFRLFTTPQERESLRKELRTKPEYQKRLEETKTLYKDVSLEYLEEEILAEDFRDFVLTNGTQPKPLSVFERIWKFLKSLFIDNNLEDYYNKILSGYYEGKTPIGSIVEDKYMLSPTVIEDLAGSFNTMVVTRLAEQYGLENLPDKFAAIINGKLFNDLDTYISYLAPEINTYEPLNLKRSEWKQIFDKHRDNLSKFLPVPEEETDEYEVTDKLGIKEANTVSPEQLGDNLVKLVISGLYKTAEVKGELKAVLNDLGYPEPSGFNKTYNALLSRLSNSVVPSEQLAILKEMVLTKPELNNLIKWFKLEEPSKTIKENQLKVKFYQSFTKAKDKFLTAIVEPGGVFKIAEEKERLIYQLEDEWKTNLTKSPFIVIQDAKYLIDHKKLQDFIKDPENTTEDILRELGYPDIENFSKYKQKDIAALSSVIEKLDRDISVDYFFSASGLDVRGRLNTLFQNAIEASDNYVNLNIIDGKGSVRYAVSSPTELTVALSLMKNKEDSYLGDFDKSTSLWYEANKEIITLMQVKDKYESKDFKDIDKDSMFTAWYRYIQNNIYPVLDSDRSQQKAIKVSMPIQPSIESLVNAVFGEINYVANRPESKRQKEYKDNNDLVIFKDAVKLTKSAREYSKSNPEDYEYIKQSVQDFIQSKTKEYHSQLQDMVTDAFNKEPLEKVEEVTIKYWQYLYEYTNLFTGPIDNLKDPFKRSTLFTSSKQVSLNDETLNSEWNILYPRTDKKIVDGFENAAVFSDLEVSYNEVQDILNIKDKGEKTDAIAFGTLDYIREMAVRLGKWTSQYQQLYDYENYLTDVYPEVSLTQKKYGYAGPGYYTDSTPSFFTTVLYKMSVVPILPRSMAGTTLATIGKKMQDKQIGLGVFNTGNKGNTLGPVNNLTKILAGEEELQITQRVNYSFFGEHLETSPDEKERVTFGTQMGKLDWVDINKYLTLSTRKGVLNTQDLLDEYNNTLNKITEVKFNNFLKSLAIKEKEGLYTFTDPEKMKKEVLNAMLQRPSTTVFKQQLESILDDAVIYADAIAEKVKLENNLMAFYNREVVKRDMPGEMFIQSYDFDGTLKFYSKADGYTNLAEIKISLPKKLIKFVDDTFKGDTFEDKLKAFNKKLKEDKGLQDVFSVIPYRIPTQGQNAIEAVKVVEFLPPTFSNVIVVPNGITIKSGSDFDIDKLTTYIKHYYPYKDTLKVLTQDSLSDIENTIKFTENKNPEWNKILKDIKSNFDQYVLENKTIDLILDIITAKETQDNLLAPDSTDALKGVSLKIIDKYKDKPEANDKDYTRTLDFPNVVSTRQKLLEFKQLVGPAALATTSHSLAQQAGLIYSNPEYKVYFKGFEDKSDYPMDLEYNIDNEEKISSVLKQFISAAVDVSKQGNDYIAYTNINFTTFGITQMLLRQGVPLKTALYFLNQPIIRDVVQLTRDNSSPVNFKKERKRFKLIRNLLNTVDKYNPSNNPEDSFNKYYKQISKKELPIKYYKESDLYSMMNIPYENMSPEQLAQQIQLLYVFEQAKNASNDIIKLQQVTKQDTAQAGKTLMNSWLNRKIYEELVNKGVFINLENMFDKTLLKELKKTAFEADKIWSSGMDFLSFNINKGGPDVIEALYNMYKSSSVRDLISIMEKADRELVTYALLTSPLDSGKAIADSSSLLRSRALIDELLDLKVRFPDNKLLQDLVPLLPEEGEYQGDKGPRSTYNIKLMSQRITALEQEELANAFTELYENPITQLFAKKLVALQLLQSGISKSRISYQNILPFEYTDIVKQALKNTPYINTKHFITEFIKQNWRDSKIAPFVRIQGYKPGQTISTDIINVGPAIKVPSNINNKEGIHLLIKTEVSGGKFEYVPVKPIGEDYYYKAYSSKVIEEEVTTEGISDLESDSTNIVEFYKANFPEIVKSENLDSELKIENYLKQRALDRGTTIDNPEFIAHIKECG